MSGLTVSRTSFSALERLQLEVDEWLDTYREFRVTITADRGQDLSVSVGMKEGIICTKHKPAIMIKYASSRIKGEWTYIVDHTCMEALRNELVSILLVKE